MRERIYGQPQQRRSYYSRGRQDVRTACEARWTLRYTVLIDRFRCSLHEQTRYRFQKRQRHSFHCKLLHRLQTFHS